MGSLYLDSPVTVWLISRRGFGELTSPSTTRTLVEKIARFGRSCLCGCLFAVMGWRYVVLLSTIVVPLFYHLLMKFHYKAWPPIPRSPLRTPCFYRFLASLFVHSAQTLCQPRYIPCLFSSYIAFIRVLVLFIIYGLRLRRRLTFWVTAVDTLEIWVSRPEKKTRLDTQILRVFTVLTRDIHRRHSHEYIPHVSLCGAGSEVSYRHVTR